MLILLALVTTCLAQTSPLAAFLGAGAPASVAYEGRYADDRRPGPSLLENKLSLTLPGLRNDTHALTPSLSVGRLDLSRPPRLSNGRAVPGELHRLEVGAQYTRQLGRGQNWGLRASVGYAGDRPFAAGDDLSYGLGGTYGFPGAKGYWVLLVLMSNNGVLPNYVPIPGFLYVYRTPRFTGVFGLPVLALTWTPAATWTLGLTAFGPLVRGEVVYGPKDGPRLVVSHALTQQVFIPSERERARDRLRLQEQRASLGLRVNPYPALSTELQAGYAFARSISVRRGLAGRAGAVDLSPAWFAGLQASHTF